MLTQIETRALNLIYAWCCKSAIIPFNWENGTMCLKSKPTISVRLYRLFMWGIVTASVFYKIYRFTALVLTRNFNSAILHGILMLMALGNATVRLCISKFQIEILALIQQTLRCNSDWGKKIHICVKCIANNNRYGCIV